MSDRSALVLLAAGIFAPGVVLFVLAQLTGSATASAQAVESEETLPAAEHVHAERVTHVIDGDTVDVESD